PVDAPPTPSAIKTPLEDSPALRDPAAVGFVPEITGSAAGGGEKPSRGPPGGNPRPPPRPPPLPLRGGLPTQGGGVAPCGGGRAPYNALAGTLLAFNQPPSGAHWFGTDSLGRDVFSRVIVGAQEILIVTPLATLLGTVLGTTIGLVQGYFLGPVDSFVGRIVDA